MDVCSSFCFERAIANTSHLHLEINSMECCCVLSFTCSLSLLSFTQEMRADRKRQVKWKCFLCKRHPSLLVSVKFSRNRRRDALSSVSSFLCTHTRACTWDVITFHCNFKNQVNMFQWQTHTHVYLNFTFDFYLLLILWLEHSYSLEWTHIIMKRNRRWRQSQETSSCSLFACMLM